MTVATELPPQMAEKIADKIEAIEETTKKGFNLRARLEGRGLRKGSIVLYLDEDLGSELGYADDLLNGMKMKVGRDRAGIIGDLDAAEEGKASAIAMFEKAVADSPDMKAADKKKGQEALDSIVEGFDARIAELTEQRDTILKELARTGITIHMKAVPPVISKDCRRLAKATLEITTKGVPEDMQEDFNLSHTAHLMTKIFTSVTDNQTGDVEDGIDYDGAMALIDLLPTSQFYRLDLKIGEVQYLDAISRDIESQEDFS
jgi:hypothetical protein